MKGKTAEDLSKLQVICSLFSKTICDDLYFAQQIKESIEASLPEDQAEQTQAFILRAQELVANIEADPSDTGIEIVEAENATTHFSMLDLRANLLEALKRTCRFDTGLVVLTGLKDAICPKGKRWSKSRKQEYEDAIAFAREFCQQRSRPSSTLSLIIF